MPTQAEIDEDRAFNEGFDSTDTAETFEASVESRRAHEGGTTANDDDVLDVAVERTPNTGRRDESTTARQSNGDDGANAESTSQQDGDGDQGTKAVDPFEGLPAAARQMLAEVPNLRAQLEQSQRMLKMIPALQSRLDKLSQQQRTGDQASQQATQRQNRPKVEALRKDGLPEIADALDELYDMTMATRRETGNDDDGAALQEPNGQEQRAPLPRTPEERTLDLERPTWVSDIGDPAFELWLRSQPPNYQASVRETDKASHILAALSHFDRSRGKSNQPTTADPASQQRVARMANVTPARGDGRRQRGPAQSDDPEEAAFTAAFNS